jgi:hypothetical protein
MAPAVSKARAAAATVLPVVTTSSITTTCLPATTHGLGDKGAAQVTGTFLTRKSHLRRCCTHPVQALRGQRQVQQSRHHAGDFVRLVEAALDQTGRVQWHRYDQGRRAMPGIARLGQCLGGHPRAEDPRIGERTLVLERLYQVRHRKLVGPGGYAPLHRAARACGSARNHLPATATWSVGSAREDRMAGRSAGRDPTRRASQTRSWRTSRTRGAALAGGTGHIGAAGTTRPSDQVSCKLGCVALVDRLSLGSEN